MKVLSVNAGADTGGISIGMKRAFDRCSSRTFRSLIRSSNYIRYPIDAPWSSIRQLDAEADVLHLHNNFRTLGMLPSRGRNKGLVITHHGSMFRRGPAPHLAEARRQRALMLVSTLDLWSMAPTATTWVPAPYDVEWLQEQRRTHYKSHDGLIVAHAPTDRMAKGTQALIAAVDRLNRSYPIELLLIERRTWQECIALKATADVFVDQLLLGYGCNGVEAMGMGIPVISGVDPAAGKRLERRHPELRVPSGTMDAMVEQWGELPYLHATQDTILEVLERMVGEKAVRDEYAAKGLTHVRRFHADQVVARRLEQVYDQSLDLRGIRRASPEAAAPDVVYVVRPGEFNEELRYSLRSLANLPHGRVWIAGYMPRWVAGATHIPSPPKPGNHIHAKANLKAACEHPDVSESFVYMNDDFFVMQPHEQLPVMHRGTLEDAVRTAGMASAYTRAMRQTLDILIKRGIAEPLMYDLHAPMLVTKAGMLEALALCSYPMIQERTLFGNLQGVGGEKRHNHKVRRQDRGWSSWPFLSTNDHTFRTLPVGEFIRGRFPTRSPYEADAPAPRATPSHLAPVPRRPIRRTQASTIRRVRVA